MITRLGVEGSMRIFGINLVISNGAVGGIAANVRHQATRCPGSVQVPELAVV